MALKILFKCSHDSHKSTKFLKNTASPEPRVESGKTWMKSRVLCLNYYKTNVAHIPLHSPKLLMANTVEGSQEYTVITTNLN